MTSIGQVASATLGDTRHSIHSPPIALHFASLRLSVRLPNYLSTRPRAHAASRMDICLSAQMAFQSHQKRVDLIQMDAMGGQQ